MDASVNTYRASETIGKTQLGLVIQVYDGAIAAYQQAREAFEAQDYPRGRDQLERAQRFVVHLYTTLDTERGGDVAANLSKLYTLVLNETNVVSATKELAKIDDIISVLDNLRDGWKGLSEAMSEDQEVVAEATPASSGGFNTSV